MVDTVILLIPKEQVKLTGNLIRDATQKQSLEIALANIKNIRNTTGKYFPAVSLTPRNRHYDSCLRIEFSAQKLLGKTDLIDADFLEIVTILQERLLLLGVEVDYNNIISAKVSSIHYSKDIRLQNGYTSSYIITELAKINTRKNIDLYSSTYANNGKSISFRTSLYQFIIYDKASEQKKIQKLNYLD